VSKVKVVEGIRGVACFMVVLSHLSLTFFPYLHTFSGKGGVNNPIQIDIYNSPFGFMYSGASAVCIFFVLSGYILTYVALKDNIHKLIAMSVKRYPRLMIPSAVSCILAYVLFCLFSFDKSMLTDWIGSYGSGNYSFLGALFSGTIKSFFIGESSYNPTLWTMKIELIGSFFIFAMCFTKYKYRVIYIDLSVIVSLVLLTVFKLLSASLGMGLIAFTVGYLFCLYGKNIKPMLSIPLFIFGLYLAGAHNNSSSYSAIISFFGEDTYLLGNFTSAILIVYSIIFSRSLNSFFSKKIFVFMGKVSFSVYLIHLPIISTLGVLCFNFLYKNFSYEEAAILASVITLFSTYTISLFYFKYVDYQGIVISNKFQKTLNFILNNKVTQLKALKKKQLTTKSI
jgi:peptidoglycan/LPS O-acetylase OafA/YrhL